MVMGAKSNYDVGVSISILRIVIGGPSSESVAHVLDSSYVPLRVGSVAGGSTLVEDIKGAGYACLCKWHYLAASWLVLREHRVWTALLKAVEVVLSSVAPYAMGLVEGLVSNGLLERMAVLPAPEVEVQGASALTLFAFLFFSRG